MNLGMYTDTCAMSPKCQDVLVLNYGKRKKYQFGKQNIKIALDYQFSNE